MSGLSKKKKPSKLLAELLGDEPISSIDVSKAIWAYIKENDLQDPKNKRNIIPDETLEPLLGRKTISMFELTKIISKHLS